MRTRWLAASAAVAIAAATLSTPRPYRARGQTAATAPSTAATPPSTTTGPVTTTRAAARPSAAVLDLIRRLGSDDDKDRDAAQQGLVDRSGEDPAVADAVRQAAAADPDPEVRGRAAATLGLIRDHDANDASPVTLHVTAGSPADVFRQIGAQAHAEVTGIIPGIPVVGMAAGAGGRTVTVDADRQPFWAVMADVCRQLGLCPVLDLPARNQIRLFPTQPRQNWITSGPHQVVGPFWVSAVGLYRSQSIDLVGDRPTTDDQFYARFVVFGEPKLVVTQMSGFTVKEATDDAGNDLAPPAAAVPPVAAARAMVLLRASRTAPRTAEARLVYPTTRPGRRIAVLRGEVAVTLAQGVQRFEADDVTAPTPTVTHPVPGATVRIAVVRQGLGGASYAVTVQATRDGMPDAQWYAMGNRINDAVLEDADGHPLTSYSWSVDSPDGGERTIRATALFSKTSFAVNLANRPAGVGQVQASTVTGDPKRFVWNVASRFKTVTVPVTFRDLPMP